MSDTIDVPELYKLLKSQLYAASAALFFNGICLLLFSFAVFLLLKTKTRASRLFLALAVVLVLFTLSQACLDVALAVVFSQMVEPLVDSGSDTQLLSTENTWARMYVAREALLAINNAITDGLLLYRCAAIWAPSRYAKLVTGGVSLLIVSTFVAGLYLTFSMDKNFTIPYIAALVTNLALLVLTAGRIWRKGRQATVVLGAEAGAKYNKTTAIICESSLLYFVNVLIYLIAGVTLQPEAALVNLSWGSLPQVVNIVPMIIMVRVGMTRISGEQEPEGRTLYGDNAGRYGMNPISEASTPLTGSGKYSRV
ncbi:hypothetical protein DFH06DRAFT_1467319 [Mycena polygramma]|nr:hypothetical protein DFH06DRAFT_1467319 [Mycena polygramma]